jgi:flagellar biogenesis protein FliO
MTSSFWLQYTGALLVVALLLGGLYAVVRGLARGRVIASAERRLLTVLESTMLSQHAAVHVVKVGKRYVMIGASNGNVSMLGDLPSDEVETWLSEQRSILGAHRATIMEAFKFLRGKQ